MWYARRPDELSESIASMGSCSYKGLKVENSFASASKSGGFSWYGLLGCIAVDPVCSSTLHWHVHVDAGRSRQRTLPTSSSMASTSTHVWVSEISVIDRCFRHLEHLNLSILSTDASRRLPSTTMPIKCDICHDNDQKYKCPVCQIP